MSTDLREQATLEEDLLEASANVYHRNVTLIQRECHEELQRVSHQAYTWLQGQRLQHPHDPGARLAADQHVERTYLLLKQKVQHAIAIEAERRRIRDERISLFCR